VNLIAMDGQVGLNPSVSLGLRLRFYPSLNAPFQQLGFNVTDSAPSTPIYHLLSGSFRSLSLFLLAFSPLHRTLSFVQRVSSLGPHQYLATNARKDVAYATSWAAPPELSSWFIERSVNNPWRIEFMNSVPISKSSSTPYKLFIANRLVSCDLVLYLLPATLHAHVLSRRANRGSSSRSIRWRRTPRWVRGEGPRNSFRSRERTGGG
jgi:hypothetical protein